MKSYLPVTGLTPAEWQQQMMESAKAIDAIYQRHTRKTDMKSYRVTWEIDIDADTPQEAARIARDIQRDATSEATLFVVTEDGGKPVTVDLSRVEE